MGINQVRREDGPLYDAVVQAGFSVGGFARRMGVARTTVWRIDRGLLSPSGDWWMRAATLLNVPVDQIRQRERLVAA